MTDRIQQARQLLEKYRQGQCTEEEILLLHQWYDHLEIPLEQTSLQEIEAPAFEQELEAGILSRIQPKRVEMHPAKERTRIVRIAVRMTAAAAALGAVALGAMYWLSASHQSTGGPVAVHSISNTGNAIKKIVLPDSTQVWLNAGAVLRWQDDFAATERKVQLEGEAYFDVAKDAVHPFLVQAKDITTRVLGTAFNIEAYATEQQVRIALVQGRVALAHIGADSTATLLSPGEVGTFQKGIATCKVSRQNVAEYSEWIKGAFILKEVPLEDALQRLCSRYGYTMQGKLPAAARANSVTGAFYHERFENIVSNILYVNYLKYTIRGKVLLIKP